MTTFTKLSAYFFAIMYLSHPLTFMQNFMEIVPRKTPPSAAALNARRVEKQSDVTFEYPIS